YYGGRGRGIGRQNEGYFTAMTYPEGLPAVLQPSDLHDAIWGVFAAVYGGAVHPTAEGHAAMADAALPVARQVLGVSAPDTLVRNRPLAPLPSVIPPRLPASGR